MIFNIVPVSLCLLVLARPGAPSASVNPGPQAPTTRSAMGRLPEDAAETRDLVKRLGAGFRPHRTAHFTIVSDADAARVRQFSGHMESAFESVWRFAVDLELPVRRPASKMTVVLFDRWEDYQAYARAAGMVVHETVPGIYNRLSDRCVLFNFANSTLIRQKREALDAARRSAEASGAETGDRGGASPEDRADRLRRIGRLERQIADYERLINATVVRHEIAHQVLRNLGLDGPAPRSRRWLAEGLAMQFEGNGGVNRYRLADLLDKDAEETPISARALISDATLMGPGAARPAVAYATAWGLVRYLIDRHPRALAGYIVNDETPTPTATTESARELAAFQRAFGRPDGAFESAFRRHAAALGERGR